MILLITFDLKQPVSAYAGMYELLKSKNSWWHYLKSTWMIATDEDPSVVADQLKPFMQKNDYFFILKVSRPYQGWLPKKAWKWIHDHE